MNMCRILVASGKVNVSKIMESIAFMAKDENSLHEMNQKRGQGSWRHADGWGIAYRDQGNFTIKKSSSSIFKKQEVKKTADLKTDFLIAHVRKKAGSEVSIKNTHPFKADHPALGECVFCHNGVIKDQIKYHQRYKAQGKTDSERLFYSILSDISENSEEKIATAIQKNLQKYSQTKGSNIVLATKDKTYVAMRKNIMPKYYGMMLGRGNDFMLISSEKLKTFPDIYWRSLLPGDVVVIHNGTTQYSIYKEKVTLLQRLTALVPR